MTLYKALTLDGCSMHGGDAQWHLPRNGEPGEWMPAIEGELIPCERGYHLCRLEHLLKWLGPTIWEVEYRGELVDDGGKLVVREARLVRPTAWSPRVAALYAADCAEHVLHLWEECFPGDSRPRDAIAAARSGDVEAAAKAARAAGAAGAIWAAAKSAAWAAEAVGAAYATRTTYAAWVVYAASEATYAAADGLAERQWQIERLREYIEGRG